MTMKPIPNITPALTLRPLSPMLERLVANAHKDIDEALIRTPLRPVLAVGAPETAAPQPAMAGAETRLDTRV
jgi:hypothetical protein